MSEKITLVFFLKPDAVIRRYVGARTYKTLLDNLSDLEFLTFDEMFVDTEFLAEQHYVEHKGKFFYEWLVDYVATGPILLSIIRTTKENVRRIREILGPTLPEKAAIEAPNTIRAKYGIMGGVNVAHASDAVETALRESKIWFEYLKSKGIDPMKSNPKTILSRVEEYINTYIDYPIIDSLRYRELCSLVKDNPSRRSEIESKIANLLVKETEEKFIESNHTKKLARILIENVLLKR